MNIAKSRRERYQAAALEHLRGKVILKGIDMRAQRSTHGCAHPRVLYAWNGILRQPVPASAIDP